jgi:predicted DCC family thiol-disulfide oxidoreductase YuxK
MRDWRPQAAADLPDRLILFDGVCVLCSGWIDFVIARDPGQRYRFVAIQSALGRALAARFGIDPDMPQSNVLVRDGQAWFKGDSALRVWRDLPGLRWTRVVELLPRPIRNMAYDLIARNRYRLFGRHPACMVPTAEIRSRFLATSDDLGAAPRQAGAR